MLTLYTLLVFVHILAVCVWIGGGFVMEVMSLRLGGHPTKERVGQFFEIAHYVSPRVFMPAAIITLFSGVTLVLMGGAAFRDLWIVLALTGVGATIILGATQIGPNVMKMSDLLESSGDANEITRISKRLHFITRIDLVILVFVLLDMILRPQF
jgi:uncharacterized membrane protein